MDMNNVKNTSKPNPKNMRAVTSSMVYEKKMSILKPKKQRS